MAVCYDCCAGADVSGDIAEKTKHSPMLLVFALGRNGSILHLMAVALKDGFEVIHRIGLGGCTPSNVYFSPITSHLCLPSW